MPLKALVLALFLTTPLLAQVKINPPPPARPGCPVMLTATGGGGQLKWKIDRLDKKGVVPYVDTANGGIAFCPGCVGSQIIVHCSSAGASNFSMDWLIINVGGKPTPVDPVDPIDPDPDPLPSLTGAALQAYESWNETTGSLRAAAGKMASNFETISSKGAAISSWSGVRIMGEINKANKALIDSLGGKEPYFDMINLITIGDILDTSDDLDLDDKNLVVTTCNQIAEGLRAVK